MLFDPLYFILIMPALLLAVYAQIKVKSAYKKYSKLGNASQLTGAQAAARILSAAGIHDVQIEPARGWLSDHYDSRTRVLRLSPQVYNMPSIAAVGIAAHEAGHAIQHNVGYGPLKFRNAIVPTAQIGSWAAFPMIFLGAILHLSGLAVAGVLLFTALVIFQVITLPVELNASARAKKVLFDMGIIQYQEEANGVAAVLNAAALTYVAATVTALAQLLYWVMWLGLLGGGDD